MAVSRFGGNRWSMNTEVDLEGRKNGFDPDEVAELEKEKKAQETPPPGIGPDFMPTGIRYRLYTWYRPWFLSIRLLKLNKDAWENFKHCKD